MRVVSLSDLAAVGVGLRPLAEHLVRQGSVLPVLWAERFELSTSSLYLITMVITKGSAHLRAERVELHARVKVHKGVAPSPEVLVHYPALVVIVRQHRLVTALVPQVPQQTQHLQTGATPSSRTGICFPYRDHPYKQNGVRRNDGPAFV